MTVAPITPSIEPNLARWYRWIPKSWHASSQEGGEDRQSIDPRNDHRVYRDRDRERDIDLDDTRAFRRRYDDQPSPSPPPVPKFQIPAGAVLTLVLYLVGQLIAGVWWGATQQANLQHEITDRAREEGKLWDQLNIYRAEVNALRIEIARVTGASNRNHRQED